MTLLRYDPQGRGKPDLLAGDVVGLSIDTFLPWPPAA